MFFRIFCAVFFLGSTAFAQVSEPSRASFEKLVIAADNNEVAGVKQFTTTTSHPLVDRVANLDLLRCLPKDSQYQSETKEGSYQLVRAGITGLNGKWQLARLYFAQENGVWKWDLNETMRRGVGENWQNKVNTAEQFIMLFKQQMGGKVDCAMIRDFIKPMDNAAAK